MKSGIAFRIEQEQESRPPCRLDVAMLIKIVIARKGDRRQRHCSIDVLEILGMPGFEWVEIVVDNDPDLWWTKKKTRICCRKDVIEKMQLLM
jgi:Holliday junction resolvase-like predicted endonuclease